MRNTRICGLLLTLASIVPGSVVATDLPVKDGRRIVANINGEPIWLRELEDEIATIHQGHDAAARPERRQDPSALLDRMITARLFVQEAKNIGLDEQPEIKAELEKIRLETMRDVLIDRVVQRVPKPDPATVQRTYVRMMQEYRVRSVLVSQEADAKRLEADLKAGRDFDTVVAALLKAGKAREGNSATWLKASDLEPHIESIVAKLKPGQASRMLQVGKAWTVIKLLETRLPEDPAMRELARQTAGDEKRKDALDAYMAGLRKSWAVVDQALLGSLDYERAGEFEKLEKDSRTVATIKGGAPVTVAQLTDGVNARFFHGIETAIAGKKVNREKAKILDDVLNRRVVEREADRAGIPATREFKDTVARREASLLFDAFLTKAVSPDVKVNDKDLEAYVAAHKSDFTEPAKMTLEALPFGRRTDAEAALAKLQKGASFAWMRTNAAGIADARALDLVGLPTGVVSEVQLPDGLRKALEGAREGDYRFWGDPPGPYLVVHLVSYSPAAPLTLGAVRPQVEKLVSQEKLGKLIEDWGVKLRKASDVKTFATPDELSKLVVRDMSAKP